MILLLSFNTRAEQEMRYYLSIYKLALVLWSLIYIYNNNCIFIKPHDFEFAYISTKFDAVDISVSPGISRSPCGEGA